MLLRCLHDIQDRCDFCVANDQIVRILEHADVAGAPRFVVGSNRQLHCCER